MSRGLGDVYKRQDPDAKQLHGLREAWRKAGTKARAEHLNDLIALGLVMRRGGK